MTQLELFDRVDDVVYCMSLTSEEFVKLRARDERAYQWVRSIRYLTNQYQFHIRQAQRKYERDLSMVIGKH